MSSPAPQFGWVEIVFSAAVTLGFGIYQLWSVNREIRRDRERGNDEDGGPPPNPPAGSGRAA